MSHRARDGSSATAVPEHAGYVWWNALCHLVLVTVTSSFCFLSLSALHSKPGLMVQMCFCHFQLTWGSLTRILLEHRNLEAEKREDQFLVYAKSPPSLWLDKLIFSSLMPTANRWKVGDNVFLMFFFCVCQSFLQIGFKSEFHCAISLFYPGLFFSSAPAPQSPSHLFCLCAQLSPTSSSASVHLFPQSPLFHQFATKCAYTVSGSVLFCKSFVVSSLPVRHPVCFAYLINVSIIKK